MSRFSRKTEALRLSLLARPELPAGPGRPGQQELRLSSVLLARTL